MRPTCHGLRSRPGLRARLGFLDNSGCSSRTTRRTTRRHIGRRLVKGTEPKVTCYIPDDFTDTAFDLHIFGYNQHSLCDKALLHSAVMDEHYDLSLASKQQYMSHYIYISHKMKAAHSEQLQRNASNLNQNCKYLLLCQYVTITRLYDTSNQG